MFSWQTSCAPLTTRQLDTNATNTNICHSDPRGTYLRLKCSLIIFLLTLKRQLVKIEVIKLRLFSSAAILRNIYDVHKKRKLTAKTVCLQNKLRSCKKKTINNKNKDKKKCSKMSNIVQLFSNSNAKLTNIFHCKIKKEKYFNYKIIRKGLLKYKSVLYNISCVF